MDTQKLKTTVQREIDQYKDEYIRVSKKILSTPESGFREHKTSRIVSEEFRRLDIPYEDGIAITGLKGTIEGGKPGPTVAVIGELDSLIVPKHRYSDPDTGAAHACGHHCQIGMMLAVARGLKTSGVMKQLSGRVILLAIPAEEYIEIGYRDDLRQANKLEFLSGKSGTQDVFFHIFNHLHQNGKQVILTSDKAPLDMQDIEQRLLSRFKWGLSAELQTPNFETRVSILKNKLFRDGVEIDNEITEYVAKNINSNVRELEGAIISLIAQSSFNKAEITLDLAKDVISKFVKNNRREVSIDYIQKVVSDYFQMDIETLQSKTRKRHIVQARQIAMYFAKKFTKASLASIGTQIGRRDHATVLHACKTVDNLSFTDKQFRKYVEDLNQRLTV